MKRAFKLVNLECANCAAKMENDISDLPGVNKATVSFMTQKLVLDADDASFQNIVDSAQKIIRKHEPDCMIASR